MKNFSRWDWDSSIPYRFENTNVFPSKYTDWFIYSMVNIPLGYLFLYLNLQEFGRILVDKAEGVIRGAPRGLTRILSRCWKQCNSRSSLIQGLESLVTFILCSMLALFLYAFALLVPGSPLLNLFQSSISFIRNALQCMDRSDGKQQHRYCQPRLPNRQVISEQSHPGGRLGI